MRQIAKRVAHWTVPPGFKDLLYSRFLGTIARRASVSSEERTVLERNRDLHNRHLGERCFILATGHSLKRQDLKLLQGEICIAVSNFFVHPDFAVINPRYYCVAPHHAPITEEAWQCWMEEMDKGTKDTVMFFGLADKERNSGGGLFAGRQVYYLKFRGVWDTIAARGLDLSCSIPAPQSVPIMALYIALYMGFRQIYLLGCDHDWILHLNTSTHFYEESQHALVRAGYNEWGEADLDSECRSYVSLWQQYKALQQAAHAKSIHIFNATAGGLLDVFPRVLYESLFVEKGKGQY